MFMILKIEHVCGSHLMCPAQVEPSPQCPPRSMLITLSMVRPQLASSLCFFNASSGAARLPIETEVYHISQKKFSLEMAHATIPLCNNIIFVQQDILSQRLNGSNSTKQTVHYGSLKSADPVRFFYTYVS